VKEISKMIYFLELILLWEQGAGQEQHFYGDFAEKLHIT
jgi:hypothetical protein